MARAREREIIEVPQGAYGEVTPSSDPNIIGMFTSGMGPCCHVMVANTRTGHTILCHADPLTDLKHPELGVPAWIDKVFPGGDFSDLSVSVGETSARDHFRGIYYDAVTEVLTEKTGRPADALGGILTTSDYDNSGYAQYGIEVDRSGNTRFINADSFMARGDYEDAGVTVLQTEARVSDSRSFLGEEQRTGPMCAYDGAHFLSEEELSAQQPGIRFDDESPSQSASPASSRGASPVAGGLEDTLVGGAAEAVDGPDEPAEGAAAAAAADIADLEPDILAEALRLGNVAAGSGMHAVHMLRAIRDVAPPPPAVNSNTPSSGRSSPGIP